MDAASMSSRGTGAAESEAQKARDSSRKLEAEVKRLSSSLAELTSTHRPVAQLTHTTACHGLGSLHTVHGASAVSLS